MMSNYTKYVLCQPESLLWNPLYWLSKLRFLFVFIVYFLLIIALFDFLFPKEENIFKYASLPILLIGLYGIFCAAKSLVIQDIENNILLYTEEKSTRILENINSGNEQINIADIESRILPNNPSKKINILNLFKNIIKEAKDRKFESTILSMEPYKEEAFDHIFRLQSIQKIALHLGILGTFVGLILALTRLDFNDTSNLQVFIFKPLFNALNIAFGTSVAGLHVAIIIGFLIQMVKRQQEIYFKNMKAATLSVVSLARNSLIDDKFFNEFQKVKTSIDSLNKRIYHESKLIETQSHIINNGISKLIETKNEFDSFITSISKTQSDFINKLNQTFDQLVPENIILKFDENFNKITEKIINSFSEKLGQSNLKIDEFSEGIKTINSSHENIGRILANSINEFKTENKELEKKKVEFYNSVTQINNSFYKKLERNFEGFISKLKKELRSLNNSSSQFYKGSSLNTSYIDHSEVMRDFHQTNERKKFKDKIINLFKGK